MSSPPELKLSIDGRLDLGASELVISLTSSARAIGIRGPSGSGKSSLLRILAGVDRRATGTLRAFGEVWQSSEGDVFLPAPARGVGWVPQDALVFPHLSVAQNLRYAGADEAAARSIAEQLGIAELWDRRPRHLSGGEAQRVSLGRAMLREPRLLLLDEPFAALDEPLRDRVSAVVQAFCQERALPLILATHDERISEMLTTDRFQIMGGRVVPSSPTS